MVRIEQKGKVTFNRAIKDFFRGYIDFKGRTTRDGYWWVMLILAIIAIVTGMMASSSLFEFDEVILMNESEVSWNYIRNYIFQALPFFLFIIIVIIPSLALTIRRNRDVGLTGWGSFCLYFVLVVSQPINSSLDFVTGEFILGDNVLLTFLTFALSVFMFLLTIIPTDTLTIKSENKILRFFFRLAD